MQIVHGLAKRKPHAYRMLLDVDVRYEDARTEADSWTRLASPQAKLLDILKLGARQEDFSLAYEDAGGAWLGKEYLGRMHTRIRQNELFRNPFDLLEAILCQTELFTPNPDAFADNPSTHLIEHVLARINALEKSGHQVALQSQSRITLSPGADPEDDDVVVRGGPCWTQEYGGIERYLAHSTQGRSVFPRTRAIDAEEVLNKGTFIR